MPNNGTRLFEELMRFKPAGLTANGWAVKAGISRAFWNDLKRHGNPSRRTLEKLLSAADSSLAEFEALRIGGESKPPEGRASRIGESLTRAWAPAALPPLPLIACALAGEWGEPGSQVDLTEIRPAERLDQLPRPAALAADTEAFAMTIVGDSMWPRFRPGRRIAVSPKAPVAIGDDVLVKLKLAHDGPWMALIMELVKLTSAFVELRQFNPEKTVRVDNGAVDAIQRVAGELI